MKGNESKRIVLTAMFVCLIQLLLVLSSAQARTEIIPLKNGNVAFDAPYVIEKTMLYKDGGTIAIIMRDAKGISVPVCYDRRIKVPESERFVYAGATYPGKSSATRIERGSPAAHALLKILSSATIPSSPHIRQDLVRAVIAKLSGKRILLGG